MEKLTPEDQETKSADIVAQNIEAMKALFPDACTEGKIDFDVLRQLLGDTIDDGEEKYGLNWHGKRTARQFALTPSTGTLRPCPEDSVDWDTTQNLMIEGDNLEVLKLLHRSYAGKVRLIYIDPPYNTGSDFIYRDDYRDSISNYLQLTGQVDDAGVQLTTNRETSGRFHTQWLNMMYPRLTLARNLLREDGVLCVSIAEEEYPRIRLLLDEVFGEEHYRNTLLVRRYDKNLNRQFMARGLKTLNVGAEYIVIYARSHEFNLTPVYRDASEERQNKGYWKGFWNAPDRPTMRYDILGFTPHEGQWKWQESVAREAIANYREYLADYASDMELEEYWIQTGRSKRFIRRNEGGRGKNEGVEHWIPPSTGILRSSNWTDMLASETLSDLRLPFDNPKNVDLLRTLVQMCTTDGDLILDFFAGSGSMGHAVAELDANAGSKRRFILVQLPERTSGEDFETIADIAKERLRRAGARISEENPGYDGDLGFRVFKLDSTNIRAWDPQPQDLEQTLLDSVDHLRADRAEHDILYELVLKLGLDLCVPIETRTIAGERVHSIGAGVLIACLAQEIPADAKQVEQLAQGIVKWHEEQAPAGETTCVFRDSAFADDVAKTNLAAILEQHGLTNVRSL